MCGRTACSLAPELLLKLLENLSWVGEDKYSPSYNVTPAKYQPIIAVSGGEKKLISMKWGLVCGLCNHDYFS